jgi:hypothetical protein
MIQMSWSARAKRRTAIARWRLGLFIRKLRLRALIDAISLA